MIKKIIECDICGNEIEEGHKIYCHRCHKLDRATETERCEAYRNQFNIQQKTIEGLMAKIKELENGVER